MLHLLRGRGIRRERSRAAAPAGARQYCTARHVRPGIAEVPGRAVGGLGPALHPGRLGRGGPGPSPQRRGLERRLRGRSSGRHAGNDVRSGRAPGSCGAGGRGSRFAGDRPEQVPARRSVAGEVRRVAYRPSACLRDRRGGDAGRAGAAHGAGIAVADSPGGGQSGEPEGRQVAPAQPGVRRHRCRGGRAGGGRRRPHPPL